MWTQDGSELISWTIHPLLPVDMGILLGADRTRKKQVCLSDDFTRHAARCVCDVWQAAGTAPSRWKGTTSQGFYTEHSPLGDSAKKQTTQQPTDSTQVAAACGTTGKEAQVDGQKNYTQVFHGLTSSSAARCTCEAEKGSQWYRQQGFRHDGNRKNLLGTHIGHARVSQTGMLIKVLELTSTSALLLEIS